jgi:hypothetical protein
MKIPVKFDPGRTSVYLPAIFCARGRSKLMTFLVDTGSCITTISCRDAERMGIDYSDLEESDRPSMTFAGYVRPLRFRDVEFLMIDENGKVVSERLKSIDILPSTGDKGLDDFLPSVIGMDFLNECSYSLYVCPKDEEAFMEKT